LPCAPGDCSPQTNDEKDDEDEVDGDDDDEEDNSSSSTTQSSTETSSPKASTTEALSKGASSTETSDSITESASTSSETCTGGETTVSSCREACSYSTLSQDEDKTTASSTLVCYTTTCLRSSGCSAQPTTATSTVTPSGTAGPSCAFDTATRYNARVSLEDMKMPLPTLMTHPIVHEGKEPDPANDDTDSDDDEDSDSDSDSNNNGNGDNATGFEVTATASATASHTSSEASSASSGGSTTAKSTTEASSTSESASQTSTSSASASSTAYVKPASCHDEADYPDHKPVDPGFIEKSTINPCYLSRYTTIAADSEPYEFAQFQSLGDPQFNQVDDPAYYEYSIAWINGCEGEPQEAAQNVTSSQAQPGDPRTCREIFVAAYEDCNNGGVGGYIDVGCLRYTFTGGRTDAQRLEASD